ncbi:MAG: YHS domain-containing protein [Candidatus Limnocylindrales bacterium]
MTHAPQRVPGNATVVDPVCGMLVEPAEARARNLHVELDGHDFYFCARGCKLDFEDDPGRYLDPGYQPSL